MVPVEVSRMWRGRMDSNKFTTLCCAPGCDYIMPADKSKECLWCHGKFCEDCMKGIYCKDCDLELNKQTYEGKKKE